MKLLESNRYIDDLRKAISNTNLSDLTGKTIFITGGLGLIASAIADVLIVDGKTTIYIGARSEQKFQKRFSGYEDVKFVQYDALVDFDS